MELMGQSVANSIYLDPISKNELLLLIDELNLHKSPGPDNIGPKLVRDAKHYLLEPLLYIFNKSFKNGYVPCQLKIAKVIPIFKKGSTTDPVNYRPISMLSVFDKLLEKLMYKRLIKFLTKNNILYGYQFGFRSGHSTTLALVEVFDEIYKKLDEDSLVMGIFLDLQKAFDTVNHKILIEK